MGFFADLIQAMSDVNHKAKSFEIEECNRPSCQQTHYVCYDANGNYCGIIDDDVAIRTMQINQNGGVDPYTNPSTDMSTYCFRCYSSSCTCPIE